MGRHNYLIDGGSCTGKTAVCAELQRRGIDAVNGDTVLAYQGDPVTGEPLSTPYRGRRPSHWNHLWDLDAFMRLVSNHAAPATYFCGSARNLDKIREYFDAVLVLQIDADTLSARLDSRPTNEFGGCVDERELIMCLHSSDRTPAGGAITINATSPLSMVVDQILSLTEPLSRR